jgi:hypothetical protein
MAKSQVLNDTAQVKKTNGEIRPNKKKSSKTQKNSLKEGNSQIVKAAKQPDSWCKRGKA